MCDATLGYGPIIGCGSSRTSAEFAKARGKQSYGLGLGAAGHVMFNCNNVVGRDCREYLAKEQRDVVLRGLRGVACSGNDECGWDKPEGDHPAEARVKGQSYVL